MIKFALTTLFASYRRRRLTICGDSRHRLRNRLAPGSESLEVRDCPSALGVHAGSEQVAHSLAIVRHQTDQAHDDAVHDKRSKVAAQTMYVAPRGKTGASAGKSPTRPLGSLALALKRAKPGATIMLAPGVYTQDGRITGKSGITIDGAGEGVTVLAGAGRCAERPVLERPHDREPLIPLGVER